MQSFSITDDCIGCTLCAKNCPANAISGKLKEKHTIDPSKCIRCGVCGRLCAKGAILTPEGIIAEKINKKEWKKPVIDKNLCAGCSLCIEKCPAQCLGLTGPAFHGDIRTVAALVHPENCIGCGLCSNACPISAITMALDSQRYDIEIDNKLNNYKGVSKMGKVYCRVFQAGMKIANYFIGYRMPDYIEGVGSLTKLSNMLEEKKAGKVLVVTDNGLMKLGLPDRLFKELEEAGIEYAVYSDVSPNPTSDNVEAGYKIFMEKGCQALVAMGGGSPMDCAKAIGARVAHKNKTVAQLQGVLKVHKKIPLFFAIPTTAGTGSETTVAAVITDSATHHKAAINDPAILPKYAVLDPELTVGLPPFITATTGLDALCHAVEAYTNHTYNTKLEDDLSKKAVRLVYDNLLTAYQDGQNIEARQNMQKAAFFAGRAFTRGCVGYVHAVGHTLGGLYGVAHGLAMSIILPHVMRQFGPAVYDKLADLADVCELTDMSASSEEKANAFIEWIEKMKVEMNIPVGADMIEEKDFDRIMDWALAEANPLYPVPVVWGKKDLRKLLETLTAK